MEKFDRLILGDCLDVLKTLGDNSVDSLVTDPPAGISFMGKAWDADKGGRDEWIKWMSSVMRECARVMKPGAHGLVWAIPRTSHWTATALEDAGFIVVDSVHHVFGSGFPKSLNIKKSAEKQGISCGCDGETLGPMSQPNRSGAPQGSQYAQQSNIESGMVSRQPITQTCGRCGKARFAEGYGTALKPAHEVWWLVKKPTSEKTVAKNVIEWGCGGLNIDGSRVGTETLPAQLAGQSKIGTFKRNSMVTAERTGRFPSNLVFSHTPYCTDDQCDIECAIKMLDGQSGISKAQSTRKITVRPNESIGTFKTGVRTTFVPQDKGGGASRFFYCAKTSTSERNAGLEDSPDKILAMSGGASAAAGRGEDYSKGIGMNQTKTVKNNHPTVKSKKLMGYLVNLITQPFGTVLDPFMGSGSTGIASLENGFSFIGIEREPEYFEIAKKRIKNTQ